MKHSSDLLCQPLLTSQVTVIKYPTRDCGPGWGGFAGIQNSALHRRKDLFKLTSRLLGWSQGPCGFSQELQPQHQSCAPQPPTQPVCEISTALPQGHFMAQICLPLGSAAASHQQLQGKLASLRPKHCGTPGQERCHVAVNIWRWRDTRVGFPACLLDCSINWGFEDFPSSVCYLV